MNARVRDAALLFVSFLSLYWFLRFRTYNFDTLNLCRFIEDGRLFVPQFNDHLLFFGVFTSFYTLVKPFFPQGALEPLTFLNAAFAAAGVAFQFLLLRRLGSGRGVSAAGAAALGFSSAYWTYGAMFETHALPTACLAAAWFLLAPNESNRNRPAAAAVITAIGLLSSAAFWMFVPALFVYTRVSRPKQDHASWIYFGMTVALWAAPFVATFSFSNHYAPKNGVNPISFVDFVKALAQSLFHVTKPMWKNHPAWIGALGAFLAALTAAAWNTRQPGKASGVLAAAGTALAVFFIIMIPYEPGNVQRFVPLLLFLWTAVFSSGLKARAGFVLCVALAAWNLTFRVLPARQADASAAKRPAIAPVGG